MALPGKWLGLLDQIRTARAIELIARLIWKENVYYQKRMKEVEVNHTLWDTPRIPYLQARNSGHRPRQPLYSSGQSMMPKGDRPIFKSVCTLSKAGGHGRQAMRTIDHHACSSRWRRPPVGRPYLERLSLMNRIFRENSLRNVP